MKHNFNIGNFFNQTQNDKKNDKDSKVRKIAITIILIIILLLIFASIVISINIQRELLTESNQDSNEKYNGIVNETENKNTKNENGNKRIKNSNASHDNEENTNVKSEEILQPEIKVETYDSNGNKTTDKIEESIYVTIKITNKEKFQQIKSIKIFDSNGNQIKDKVSKAIGNDKADGSFKIEEKGKYTIEVIAVIDGKEVIKKQEIEIDNLPESKIEKLQCSSKLYTIDGNEIKNQKHAREILTLRLNNINSFDGVNTEEIRLKKKATSKEEKETNLNAIRENGKIKIIGDNTYKTGVASYEITSNGIYEATVVANKSGIKKSTTFEIKIDNIEIATPSIETTQKNVDGYTTRKKISVKVANKEKFDFTTISIDNMLTEEMNVGFEAEYIVNKKGTYKITVEGNKDGIKNVATGTIEVSALDAPTPEMKITQNEIEGYTSRKTITVKLKNKGSFDKTTISIDKKMAEESNNGEEAVFIVNENQTYTITVEGIKDGMKNSSIGTIEIKDLKAPTPAISVTQSEVDGYTTRKRITVEVTNKESFDSLSIGISEKLEEERNNGNNASFIVDKNQKYTITVIGKKEGYQETYSEDVEVKELVAPTPSIEIEQSAISGYTSRKKIYVIVRNRELFDKTDISIDKKIDEEQNSDDQTNFTVNENQTYTVTVIGTKDGMETTTIGKVDVTDLRAPTPILKIKQSQIEGYTTRKRISIEIANKEDFDSTQISINEKLEEESNTGTEASYIENKNQKYTITIEGKKEGFSITYTEDTEITDLAAPVPTINVMQESVSGYLTRKRIKVKLINRDKYDKSEISISDKLEEENNDGKEANFIVDKNQKYIIKVKGEKEGFEETYTQGVIVSDLVAPKPIIEITQSKVEGYTTRKRINVKVNNKEKFDTLQININDKMEEENNNGEEANFIVDENQTYEITVKGVKDGFEGVTTNTTDVNDLELAIPAITIEQNYVEGYTTRKRISIKLTNEEQFDESTIEISKKMSEESNNGKEAEFIVNKNQIYKITVKGKKDKFNTTYTERLLVTGIEAPKPEMEITQSEVENYTTRKRITVKVTNTDKFDLTTINIDKKIEEESNDGTEANFIVNENGKYTIGVLGIKDDNNNNTAGTIEINDLKAPMPIVTIEQENVEGYTTRKRIKVKVTNNDKFDSLTIKINKNLKQEKNTGSEASFIVNENQTYTITVVGKKESFSTTYTGNITVSDLSTPIPITEITTEKIDGWTTRKYINVKVTNMDKYDTATISIDKKLSEVSNTGSEAKFIVNENGKYTITVNVDKDGIKNSATGTIEISDLKVETPNITITQSNVEGYTTRKRITVKVINKSAYDSATIVISDKLLEENNDGTEANFVVNKNQKYTITVTGKKESFTATYTEETTVTGLAAALPTMTISTSSVEGYTTRKRITVKITNTDKFDTGVIGIDKKILEESNTGTEANFIVNENRKYTITVVGIKDGISNGASGTIEISDLKAPAISMTVNQENVEGYTTRKRIKVSITNKDKYDSSNINISDKMIEESNDGKDASFIVNKNQEFTITATGKKESFSSTKTEKTTVSGLVVAVPTIEITKSEVEGYTSRKRITVKTLNMDKFDLCAIKIDKKLSEEYNVGGQASFIVNENRKYTITAVGMKDEISNGASGTIEITDLKAPEPTFTVTQSSVDGYTSRKRISVNVTNKDKFDSATISISDKLTEEKNTGTEASYIVNKNQKYTITVTGKKDNFTSTSTKDTTVSGLVAPTPIITITQSNVEGYTTRKRITATISNKDKFDSATITINDKLEEESNNGTTANFIVDKNKTYTVTVVGVKDNYSITSTKDTTVSGLSVVAPELEITQSSVSGYTTRKRITVKITNKQKYDSATISINTKLSEESNTGTEANFIVNRNQEYTITAVGKKDESSATSTGKTTVSALGAEVPTVAITQSNVNGYTSRKRINAKVTNNSKFDTLTISIDNKLSQESNTGKEANFIVNKNQTYKITVTGTKDGFNATYTGSVTVSGLAAPTPTVSISQSSISGYTTRKKITVNITNRSSFDSATISIDNKLSEDSNNGTKAEYTVSKNQTYTITVKGTKDNFTSTYTGTTTVSGLVAPTPVVSVTNTISSDKKTATINSTVTNTSAFDSLSSFTKSYSVTKNGTYTTTVTGTKDGFSATGSGSTTVSNIDISSYVGVTISGSKSQSSLPAKLNGSVQLYDANATGKWTLNSSSTSLGTNSSSYSNSFSNGTVNISLSSGGTYYLHTLISDGYTSTENIKGPIEMSVSSYGGDPIYHTHSSSCYTTHTHNSSCYSEVKKSESCTHHVTKAVEQSESRTVKYTMFFFIKERVLLHIVQVAFSIIEIILLMVIVHHHHQVYLLIHIPFHGKIEY